MRVCTGDAQIQTVFRMRPCYNARFGEEHVKDPKKAAALQAHHSLFESLKFVHSMILRFFQDITEKNASTIDKEGWLHSGDKACANFHVPNEWNTFLDCQGYMDTNGVVRITGRYKELIIGAGELVFLKLVG